MLGERQGSLPLLFSLCQPEVTAYLPTLPELLKGAVVCRDTEGGFPMHGQLHEVICSLPRVSCHGRTTFTALPRMQTSYRAGAQEIHLRLMLAQVQQ